MDTRLLLLALAAILFIVVAVNPVAMLVVFPCLLGGAILQIRRQL